MLLRVTVLPSQVMLQEAQILMSRVLGEGLPRMRVFRLSKEGQALSEPKALSESRKGCWVRYHDCKPGQEHLLITGIQK